jgi:uncharacterized protein (DUF2062 family)
VKEEAPPAAEQSSESRLPGPLLRLKRWMVAHHVTLMAIKDTPHSIALGSAIGVFFGFTPLWSLKTLLSIAVAWVCRSNKIAAAIAVTLHDVLLPFMPAIYLWEYKLGYWMLHGVMPARIRIAHVRLYDYFHWGVFHQVIWPTLIGSLFVAVPTALVTYFLIRFLVSRAQTGDKTA